MNAKLLSSLGVFILLIAIIGTQGFHKPYLNYLLIPALPLLILGLILKKKEEVPIIPFSIKKYLPMIFGIVISLAVIFYFLY